MKNLNIYILLFASIALFSFTYDFGAPSEKKLTGKWESVFRAGDNNCGDDLTLTFELDGKAVISNGIRYSECKSHTSEVVSWEVSKKEQYLKGRVKKWNTIVLKDKEDELDNIDIFVTEFVGDYMKVYIEVVMGDTTGPKKFIMKKVE